jgi:hypothetical protein
MFTELLGNLEFAPFEGRPGALAAAIKKLQEES